MKQQNINALKYWWILVTLFYSPLMWAQPYSGGINSGAVIGATVASICTPVRYFGGAEDGNGLAATNSLNCFGNRFFGDTADGSGNAKTSLFNCTVTRFFGDTADGSAAFETSLTNCTLTRFFGDTADGNSKAQTSLTNCTNQRFFGDTADGFASAKFLLIRKFLGNDTSVTIICSNETFNLLTLYTTPENLTYNWNSATPAAAVLGTYQLIATNQSGCVDTALATLKQEIAVWNGSVSNDWHTTANWNNNKIPDSTTHVIIPAGTANPCRISISDAAAASVQARASGSFSIINNRLLFISGTCISLPAN